MSEHLKARFSQPGPKRILALDGGGVRGLLTIGMLAQLEEDLRRRSGNSNYRLCQYFDLIGGTSTGSIIATGLALGMSVAEISALYKDVIPKVFKRPWLQSMGIFAPLFNSGPLANALTAEFRGRTLESEDLCTGLAIHSKRIDTGSAWIVTNNANWVYARYNFGFRLRDIVQASAAAPHYFQGVFIKLPVKGDADMTQNMFVIDGGVGGYNNPAFELALAATDPAFGYNWKPGKDQMYILSLGTGFFRERTDAKRYRRKTFVGQTLNALRGMIHDVSLQQIAYMQALSESGQRWYINSEKQDQPTAPYLSPEPLFHFQRYDVRIEEIEEGKRRPEHAQKLLGAELTPADLRALGEITNSATSNLDMLYEIGARAGRHYLSVASPPQKFDPTAW
jgi:predicted acylesterase/phospholipase RssA